MSEADRRMRFSSIPILLALAALNASGQKISRVEKFEQDSQAVWSGIKADLESKDGNAFFELNLKRSLLPGGAKGVRILKGTVVSSSPAANPNELVLAISDRTHPEVTLKLADHLRGPVGAGSSVAFSGIVTDFTKEPFNLTVEVEGEDSSRRTFALVLAVGPDNQPDSAPMPAIWVNYHSRLSTGFAKIDLYGMVTHTFTVNDHDTTIEMTGVRLERFLTTAGWYSYPSGFDRDLHYAIEVAGAKAVAKLDLLGPGSFEKQAWLVPNGTASKREASLVVVRADGTLIERVEGVQKIQVSEVK